MTGHNFHVLNLLKYDENIIILKIYLAIFLLTFLFIYEKYFLHVFLGSTTKSPLDKIPPTKSPLDKIPPRQNPSSTKSPLDKIPLRQNPP